VVDMVRSIAAVLLTWHPEKKVIHVIVIISLWSRFMELFTSTEKVARAILPILHTAKGLGPAILVFGIGYGLCFHVFYAVQDTRRNILDRVLFNSFSALITAGLPDRPLELDHLELTIWYLSVGIFSIFFLNIFIGVIGESYATEKERSALTFQELRAQSCLTFLLRSSVTPGEMMSKAAANALATIAACCAMILQVISLRREDELKHIGWIFIALQLIMYFSAFQIPDEPWGKASSFCDTSETTRHFLWVCKPYRLPEPEPATREEMRAVVQEEFAKLLQTPNAERRKDDASLFFRANSSDLSDAGPMRGVSDTKVSFPHKRKGNMTPNGGQRSHLKTGWI